MAHFVLTIVDTTGIQDYIFGSNRLRENIGASYLVEQATTNWVYEALPKPNNLPDVTTGKPDRTKHIEDDRAGLTAELIYAGGGNAALLFRAPRRSDAPEPATEDAPQREGEAALREARAFVFKLSQRVLREAPGLELVIVHSQPFTWSTTQINLADEVEALRQGALARKKRMAMATPTPLLGLSVTAECASSGLMATRQISDPEPRLVSEGIAAKSNSQEAAKARLLDFIKDDGREKKYAFSDELDHLGRAGGEESYLAVVHLDGNDMGKLIEEYAGQAADNRDYINRMRDFSDGVKEASRNSFVELLRLLDKSIKPVTKDGKEIKDVEAARKKRDGSVIWRIAEAIPQSVPEKHRLRETQRHIKLFHDPKKNDRQPCWPFRPIVFGGDDVTFVCDGRLGWALATVFMRKFAERTKELLGQKFHTGAGVSIVKVHYPFQRAYKLSESLAESAKRFLGSDKKRQASAIDWHISLTGLSGSLNEIRKSEYELPGSEYKNVPDRLFMRPVWLLRDEGTSLSDEWRAWRNFERLVAAFNYDKRLAGRRSKLKSFGEALRGTQEERHEFLTKLNKDISQALPPLSGTANELLREDGWEGGRCAYFDALEAMDHYFLLEEVKADGPSC